MAIYEPNMIFLIEIFYENFLKKLSKRTPEGRAV